MQHGTYKRRCYILNYYMNLKFDHLFHPDIRHSPQWRSFACLLPMSSWTRGSSVAACCLFHSPTHGCPLTHVATFYKMFLTPAHLERPTTLLTAEVVHMYCIKQHDTVNESGRNSGVDKEMANASAWIGMKLLSLIDAFSTFIFSSKIWSLPSFEVSLVEHRLHARVLVISTYTRHMNNI